MIEVNWTTDLVHYTHSLASESQTSRTAPRETPPRSVAGCCACRGSLRRSDGRLCQGCSYHRIPSLGEGYIASQLCLH